MSVLRVTRKFKIILSGHQRIRIMELAVLMVFGGFFEMCSVSLVMPFMNAIVDPEIMMTTWYAKFICDIFCVTSSRWVLIFLAIALAGVYILKNVYLLVEYNIQYRFVYNNMFAMQRRLLGNYINRPYEYFLSVNSGEIIRIVSSDTPSAFVLLSTLLNLFTEIAVSGLLVLTIFVITPTITIFMAVILLFLLFIINKVIKPLLNMAGVENQNNSAGMYKWLLQAIQGIKELKIMGKETYFQEKYDEYGCKYVGSIRKSQTLSVAPRFIIEAISMSMMFVIVAVTIINGTDLEALIPVITAVAMAALRLLPSVNRISGAMATIAYNEPMLDKLLENLETIDSHCQSLKSVVKETDSKLKKERILLFRERIDFHNIFFHYPGVKTDVLSDASMIIEKGESVGIVGSSGAGKTTAVDLLLGLLQPQKGNILIDGIDIANDPKGWREQIGYIPQSIFMLDDTIKSNVCFGEDKDAISIDQMWNALEEASLVDFVTSLPDGIDTEIGERGVRLSGGQRQRIGIARALYRNPSVIVFDEATSALDSDTESAIMDSIHKLRGQKTMIIIAHRLSTIEACDHIYEVESGRIVKRR